MDAEPSGTQSGQDAADAARLLQPRLEKSILEEVEALGRQREEVSSRPRGGGSARISHAKVERRVASRVGLFGLRI